MSQKRTKKRLAKELGISRSSLYYHSKLKERDEALKQLILTTLSTHPSYGHHRLALHLKRHRKCILRIMKKFAIKPYRRRARRPGKPEDLLKDPLAITNIARTLCPLRRNVLWASDFTYLWFQGKFWYLATVMDVYSRKIVGYSFSSNHFFPTCPIL